MSEDFFTPPTFDAEQALVGLRRQLRDLRELSERGPRFELRGCSVVELAVSGTAIEARLARKPQVTPQWNVHRLASSADVRRFHDAVKLQMARWRDE